MSQPGDDAMFVRPPFTKSGPVYPWHDWDRISRATETWPVFGPLVQEIRARGMDRSLHGMLSISGLVLSMGGDAGWGDAHLLISRSVKADGQLVFEYVHSHRDPRQDWRATYPPEQVLAAFYRFVTRAGWFPEGHPMLAGLEDGIAHVQA